MIIFVVCALAAGLVARAGNRCVREGRLDAAAVAIAASTGLMGIGLFCLTVGLLS